MKEILYDIENTQCAYDEEKIILEIEHLIIPEGKIIFFVGPSGVGKSTILDTLGMMNNTIHSSSKFKYKGRDMAKLWLPEYKQELSLLRNSDFSFIFQQNNLMPNFSAYENAMTAALFQGQNREQVRKKVRDVFERLDLPKEDRDIQEYSGGQQQRIAFARAIIPNFSVLFGDEPTGNLDCVSADNLINVLSTIIREKGVTAIIVSHDIHLALKYADMIVQIQKKKRIENDKEVSYGVIDEFSIYKKNNQLWYNLDMNYSDQDLHKKFIEELR